MKRLFIKTVVALLCGSAAVCAYDAPASQRAKYNFNSRWKLFVGDAAGAQEKGFDDSAWKDVTLPRAWNEDDAFRKDIKDLSTGVAWYRKHFKLPATTAGHKVFIEFEGIRQGGEFYLNGKLLGRHENGVMAFAFDLTDALKLAPEDNVLAVRVDNSWDYKEKATGSTFQWNDKNFYANYGGINKNVYLRAANVSEVTLKLANWRTRSYPIQIMVDDRVVFTGETPRSLGYVTLTFPPVTGRSVKIQLTDNKDDGTLAVVELEIYEALATNRHKSHKIVPSDFVPLVPFCGYFLREDV